jgi:hypothetical protein
MRGGNLTRKPRQFFRDFESREDLNSLMFMPEQVERGAYVYFAGYSSSGKGGADLFRVRKSNTRGWGNPERIDQLNTDRDELLPYFDPIENDLYFSSDGREGVGGFDLFKSHYDSERDEWTEPMNLGFPLNSVNDDYLLLPGNDLGMVMFFTNRQGSDSTLTVYRVHLMEPREPLSASDTRKIRQISLLGGAAADALAVIESVQFPVAERPSPVQASVEKNDPEKTGGPAGNEKSDYQVTLARALLHQSRSDSLSQLATETRVKVRNSDDPNDRWVWQKQIMVWEKKAGDEQQKAAELFASLEDKGPARKISSYPAAISVDTVINDITVYTYNVAGETGNKKKRSVSSADRRASLHVEENELNDFAIAPSPPYSASNPIPIDPPLPMGVFYRIQLGAYSRELPPGTFGGLSPISGERIVERGLIKYFAGMFNHYEDAAIALQKVKTSGYPDAFIVAYRDQKTTSITRARSLER